MNWIKEYKASLKDIPLEELPDLVFFRPLAFLLVKLLVRFPVTPNQISLSTIAIGFVTGVILSFGGHRHFILGAILYGFANVVDCADGMLARLKKNGTMIGKTVDAAADGITTSLVYGGFTVGLIRAQSDGLLSFSHDPALMMALTCVCTFLHAVVTDKYRTLYDAHVNGNMILPEVEKQRFTAERDRLKEGVGNKFDIFAINVYLLILRLQTGGIIRRFVRIPAERYRRYQTPLVIAWNLAGQVMHISVFIIAAILYRPGLFFGYTLIVANIWVLVLYVIQKAVDRIVTMRAA